MRDAFAAALLEAADRDPRVVLLSGDIGNRMFDSFKDRHPSRFFNCGVAEQSMLGVAAGMAMSGLRPVVYTIAPFVTFRCLEQIRVDLCYHRVPVVLVGVGAGLGYANLGATHHSCEDVAMLRTLPEMTVACPADPVEVRLALPAALRETGPVYLRIGKKGEPVVHSAPPHFELGRGIPMPAEIEEASSDPTSDKRVPPVWLLSTGTPLQSAVEGATRLRAAGIPIRVVSLHTVKPLDERLLLEAFTTGGLVVTLEEHSRIGGLGGAVAEWRCDREWERAPGESLAPLVRLGTPDRFPHETCSPEEARRWAGLTAEQIAETIQRAWRSLATNSR